jgi:hypothetical protein
VIALPQLDNRLLLRTVSVTDGVYAIDAGRDRFLSIESNAEPLLEPALALSTSNAADGSTVLAVTLRRGCGGDGAVYVKLFDVDGTDGTITARSGAPRKLNGSGSTSAESHPTIAFAPEHQSTWFVVYIKQSDLRARVLSFDGTLHGEQGYTLISGAGRIGLTPAAFPTPVGSFSGARFGALADATIDGKNGVYTVHLGCFDSGS